MRFSFLKKKIVGSKYVGIEHFFSDNEKIALIEVERKNNELILLKEDIRSFNDSFLNIFDIKKPYCLIINTNQVIQKEIQEATNTSDNKLLNKGFPNIKWEDFYYEIWRLKHTAIISICRKSYVEELLTKYKENHISIVQINLGNSPICNIVDFLPKNQLETNQHSLNFNDGETLINAKEKQISIDYEINELRVSNTKLLGFSAVLGKIINKKLTTGNLDDLNNELDNQYFQNQFFRKGIQVSIGVLLLFLLVNFFIFTNYFNKVQENSKTLLLNNSSQVAFVKLKNRIKTKVDRVEHLYGKPSSHCTILLNEITKTIPNSILLSELIYQPLEKKIKNEEPILAQDGIIIVSGTTINDEDFTNWVGFLEQLKFIDKIVIINFGKNEEAKTIFSLKLLFK